MALVGEVLFNLTAGVVYEPEKFYATWLSRWTKEI